jgi:hypothetical protein
VITVQCGHCQKTFTFDPATTPRREKEHMANGAGTFVEYRPACTHCGRRSEYLFREKK